ncbi:MAG: chorismate-binding protein [Chitinophagaceae bacterium]|nr:chorismate-binding protein [Chitinophagaceae bacterium]
MKYLTISIAQTLFTKNIAFCLYRFPAEKNFRIAIEPEFLPHPKENTFWITPFCQYSTAKDILLDVLNKDFLNDSFLQYVHSLAPREKKQDVPLPAESTKEDYFKKIHAFLRDIHAGKLDKAILSRVLYEDKPEDFDMFDCFLRLSESYPGTFVHLLVHPRAGIWLGATAELLLKKRDKEISIMALAGTQSRRDGKDYLWRTKEMEEHLMVSNHIEAVFQKYGCLMIKKEGPHNMETGRVAHLATDYIYEEHATFNLKSLLGELHPTPAVGGLPVGKGVEYILEHEGYDRRYYCGFIGETDFTTSADLYINLRNMQIGTDRIAIYVGGGITAASDPEEEWQETVMKSSTMLEKIQTAKTSSKNVIIR